MIIPTGKQKIFTTQARTDVNSDLYVHGEVVTLGSDGMAWERMVTESDLQSYKDLVNLLLRERNGDKSASAVLDKIANDLDFSSIIFSHLLELASKHIPRYTVDVVDKRISSIFCVISLYSEHIDVRSSYCDYGGETHQAWQSSYLIADPKVFEKVEAAIVKAQNEQRDETDAQRA